MAVIKIKTTDIKVIETVKELKVPELLGMKRDRSLCSCISARCSGISCGDCVLSERNTKATFDYINGLK